MTALATIPLSGDRQKFSFESETEDSGGVQVAKRFGAISGEMSTFSRTDYNSLAIESGAGALMASILWSEQINATKANREHFCAGWKFIVSDVELNFINSTVRIVFPPVARNLFFAEIKFKADFAPPSLEAEFRELVKQWKDETFFHSSNSKIFGHPAYQRIIAMGTAGLPLVLRELQQKPDKWFYALKFMAGENGKNVAVGMNAEEARAAWLEWGHKNNYI